MTRLGLFDIKAGNPDFKGVPPTPEKTAAIRDVLDRCDYPWARILPNLPARREGRVPVVFESRGGSGSYWRNVAIVIEPRLSVTRTAELFIYEAAHMVDHLTLDDADRMALHTVFHGGGEVHDTWGQGAHHEQAMEAYMYAFYNAFVERGVATPAYGVHDVTDWQTIRDITLRRPIVPFADIDGHTHRDAIEWAASQGLLEGKGDGTFDPNEPVTRGQLASILRRYHERNTA